MPSCGALCTGVLRWLLPQVDCPLASSDVLDMVDVLVEGSEGLDEEIGFLLNEDMILLTFPFSAVVPAALEARNKLLLGTESETGTHVLSGSSGCTIQLGLRGVGGVILGPLKIIVENPRQQGSDSPP